MDFIARVDKRTLAIRTFERGVEAETVSCGTGAVAAAVIGQLLGLVRAPVRILTAGGETLRVGLTQNGDTIRNVWLEGRAWLVYEGTLHDVERDRRGTRRAAWARRRGWGSRGRQR